jgi:hypothetical protein
MQRSSAALVAILLVLAVPAVSRAAAGLPAAPSGASQGGSFVWRAGAVAPRRVLLSHDARASKGDVRLTLDRRAGGGSFRATVPATARLGSYRLLVCGARCRAAAGTFTVLPGRRRPRALGVTPVAQPAHTVTRTVGDAGGELTTTADDGTRFTLTVPQGALVGDTELTMTPVAAARGLPLQRLGAAADLGPEGVRFLRPVTLRIEPPTALRRRQVVPLLWSGAGRDVHLEPATVGPRAVTFELFHFSTPGYGLGTGQQYDRLAGRTPSSRESWARQNLERVMREQRSGGQFGAAARAAVYVFGNEVARPALEAALNAASPSQAAIAEAISLELAYERQAELTGLDEDEALSDLRAALRKLVDQLIDRSEKLADERCQRGDPTQALIILGAQRTRELTGTAPDTPAGADARLDAFDAIARCQNFEVTVDSEIAVTGHAVRGGDGGGTFGYRVTATVPLHTDPSTLRIVPGTAPLAYTAYTGQRVFPGGCATETDTPVRAPTDPASVTVDFAALHLYPAHNPDPGVELSLTHSNPAETFLQSDNCNGGPGTEYSENGWADAFRRLHLLEKPGGDRDPASGDAFVLTRFKRGEGFLFARKEYTQSVQLDVDQRNLNRDYAAVEHTIIDVRHRPLPKGTPVG